jgi:site-specific DNA-methyltransferase (cytosine-N4-specific)
MTVRLLIGDCRERLKGLPSKSVHICVTSPPYFGLRDYGQADQIGLEPTPDEFVAALVEVFREVRRVLRDDGTLWLNLGDSYAGGGGGNYGNKIAPDHGQHQTNVRNRPDWLNRVGLKPKDLIGIPWRVAFALQADGWFLRQDIIWHKPNPMPESVRDRCTKAHEYVFLLSKGPRYHFDAEAIQEPRTQLEDANGFRGGAYTGGEIDNSTLGKRRTPGNKRHKAAAAYDAGDEKHRTKSGLVAYCEREREADPNDLGTRNKRSVWTVGSEPFKEAHFATYPPALIEPCILAGCPKGGTVLDPFGGAGTTGLVADRLQRDAVLIELNPEYAEIARKRLNADGGMFSTVEAA